MQNKSKFTSENTVFFSTANAGYAIYSAISLLTIRKHVPDAQLFILSSGLSDYDRRILERHSIDYLEIDLSKIFTKSWKYPVDCYYIFAGPEIFYEQGFKYSVYVDGDMLCDSNPLELISDVENFAGVEAAPDGDNYTSIFGKDWNRLRDIFSLGEDVGRQKRFHSGVVYFNNKSMRDMKLLDTTETLYKKCLTEGVPRKGDDSLFSLLQYVHFTESEIELLPDRGNYTLQFHKKWQYPVKGLVFFHFSVDKPWKPSPYSHQDARLDVFNPYVREWRRNFRKIAPKAWLNELVMNIPGLGRMFSFVRKVTLRMRKLTRDQVLWVRGLKGSLWRRLNNHKKEPIKLFWWRGKKGKLKNFGDEITRDIITSIFGYQCKITPIEKCNFIGTGSIIELAAGRKSDNKIKVWGSGYIHPSQGDDRLDGLTIYSVRGVLTRDRVGKDLPIGDPGLLANIVYDRARYVSNKIGVVAHYTDLDLPIIKKMMRDPRFTIINPLDSPNTVARKISSCKLVLSSSLHGLIFADSFKVPNIHIKPSDNLKGGTYKFKDYYTALGKEYRSADLERLFDTEYLEDLRESYLPVSNLAQIQRGIIRAFPADI